MFVVSGSGDLSTDSLVRRQNYFQSSSNASMDLCGHESWVAMVLGKRIGVVTLGIFQENICLAVSCHGRHSRRPRPGWCWHSSSGRKTWLSTSFGLCSRSRLLAAAQESRLYPSGDMLQPQLMFWQVKSLECRKIGMAIGVSQEGGGLQTLMISYPAMSAHNSVSECSGDWLTNVYTNC